MAQISTDSIPLQMQNLIPSHEYEVRFQLHNPDLSKSVYLDRYIIKFTAASNLQNIFVLLTKDYEVPMVAMEVTTTDLTDYKVGSSSMVIQCPDVDTCGAYFLPYNIDIVP
jgi:hypothetical protein